MGTASLTLMRFCIFMLVKSLAWGEICYERQELWIPSVKLTPKPWRETEGGWFVSYGVVTVKRQNNNSKYDKKQMQDTPHRPSQYKCMVGTTPFCKPD